MRYFALVLKTAKTQETKVIYETFTAPDLLTAAAKLEEFIEGRGADLFNLTKPSPIVLKNYLGRAPKASEIGVYNTTHYPWKQIKIEYFNEQIIADIGSKAGRLHIIQLKEQRNLFS